MPKLPLQIPAYQTIPAFTQGLAILYGNNCNIAALWLVNNCQGLYFCYNPNDNNSSPYLKILPEFVADNSILLDNYKIPHEMISDFLSFVRESLNNSYYVIVSVDTFYIPCHSRMCGVNHFAHPLLIYGYEGTNFYVADHFITNEINTGNFFVLWYLPLIYNKLFYQHIWIILI